MFSLFKNKNESHGTGDKHTKVALTPDDNHIISSPKQISSVLSKLMESNEMVSLRASHKNDYYNTAIVKLDQEHGYLVLDEVIPKEANAGLKDAKQFFLHARMDGIDTSCKVELQEVLHKDNNIYYKASFPTALRYIQRRESYRVNIPLAKTYLVRITHPDGVAITGELNDISVTGVSLRFSSLVYRMQQGDIAPDCTIQLEDDTLTLSLEIRHVRESGNGYLVGARFKELDKRQERVVQQFVHKQEREMRRRETTL